MRSFVFGYLWFFFPGVVINKCVVSFFFYHYTNLTNMWGMIDAKNKMSSFQNNGYVCFKKTFIQVNHYM